MRQILAHNSIFGNTVKMQEGQYLKEQREMREWILLQYERWMLMGIKEDMVLNKKHQEEYPPLLRSLEYSQKRNDY